MSLTIACVNFSPTQGAIADNFREMVRGLREHARVITFSLKGLIVEASKGDDVAFENLSLNPLSFLASKINRQALRSFCGVDADIVFYFSTHPFNAPLAASKRRCTQVAWWHEPPQPGRHALSRATWNRLCDASLRPHIDLLLFASEEFVQWLPQRFRATDRHRIIRLPSLSGFLGSQLPAAQSASIDLLFIGKIETYKGLDLLADALRLLRARNLSPSVSVYGKGIIERDAPGFFRLHQEWGNQINLNLGFHDYEVLRNAIASSRFVILPYLSVTATNTVPIVWALWRTVIAPRLGYFSEIVADGRTGFLFEPGDAKSLADTIEAALAKSVEGQEQFSKVALIEGEKYKGSTISAQIFEAAAAAHQLKLQSLQK